MNRGQTAGSLLHMKRYIFKTISRRAHTLLERREGNDVEFKSQLNGLDPCDIVAFANSRTGGTIFIGIAEDSDGDSIQNVEVVGCDVGDKEKQIILGKAQTCIPPVDVEIYVENLGAKPFFRIEIPSGPVKPYCTAAGAYKIRGDGRTNALYPGTLLSMFVEAESSRFLSRFKEATRELEDELKDLKEKLAAEFSNNRKAGRSGAD